MLLSITKNFYTNATKLWEDELGQGITWRTAMAYDTTNVIIKGLRKVSNGKIFSRESLQKKLAKENFALEGATGLIKCYVNCPTGENSEEGKIECSPAKRMITNPNAVTLIELSKAYHLKLLDTISSIKFTEHYKIEIFKGYQQTL